MFDLFKREKGTGAILDFRSEEMKEKDYTFDELVIHTDAVDWKEKPESEWRKFPIYNQNGSGSCVAQTAAKLLGISYFLKEGDYVHFSATDIYQRRINKPGAGMIATNAFDIIRKGGATLEELAPSQSMTDAQMDNTVIPEYKRKVGEVFKVSNYVIDPSKDIDAIASIIQKTGKGVMVWFFFRRDEWTTVPTVKYPNLKASDSVAARHSITAVDFTMYKGKKALIVEDSWGTSYGKAGQRIITEDFFKVRNFFAAHLMNFDFETEPSIPKPRARFTKTMEFSPSYVVVEDVKRLQDILKFEKLFPSNVDSTGYYGAVTAKAVLAFQQRYAVDSPAELIALRGRICGPKTIAKLNQLYP